MNSIFYRLLLPLLLLCPVKGNAYTLYFGEDQDGAIGVRSSFTNANAAQADFLNALSTSSTATFESGPLSPINFGIASATLSGPIGLVNQPTGTNPYAAYPHSGNRFLQSTSGQFDITFSVNIGAFGFYAIDIADSGGDLWLRITQANGNILSINVPESMPSADGSALFFGLVAESSDEWIKSAYFYDPNNAAELFAFDDFIAGIPIEITEPGDVPEPETWLLLLFGLGGLYRKLRAQGGAIPAVE